MNVRTRGTRGKMHAYLLRAILCLLFVVITGQAAHQTSSVDQASISEHITSGCFDIFLDVGANIGVHGRFLLQPEQYINADVSTSIFNKYFGPPSSRDNRYLCVFAFEPNPVFNARHKELESFYKRQGWRYHYLPFGVSDIEGHLDFYHQDDAQRGELGFSIYPRFGRNTSVERVRVIRLSKWLQQNIVAREVPKLAGMDRAPRVIMKLDIENSEFSVLPDLIFSGALCSAVDYVFGEFHTQQKFPAVRIESDPDTGRGGLNLSTSQAKRTFVDQLLLALHSLRGSDCKTQRFDEEDDETYWRDPVKIG